MTTPRTPPLAPDLDDEDQVRTQARDLEALPTEIRETAAKVGPCGKTAAVPMGRGGKWIGPPGIH